MCLHAAWQMYLFAGWKLKDKRGIAFDQVEHRFTLRHSGKDAEQTGQSSKPRAANLTASAPLPGFPSASWERETLGLGFSKEVGGQVKSLPGLARHTAAPTTLQAVRLCFSQALTCPPAKPRARGG